MFRLEQYTNNKIQWCKYGIDIGISHGWNADNSKIIIEDSAGQLRWINPEDVIFIHNPKAFFKEYYNDYYYNAIYGSKEDEEKLNEAIDHLRKLLGDKLWDACDECKDEHKQLYYWLKELKERKGYEV